LRQNLKPGGFGMILYQCVDDGEISEDEAHKLVRSMLTAGVDTTVKAVAAALRAGLNGSRNAAVTLAANQSAAISGRPFESTRGR
jgi:hypothetical protein